MRKPFAPSLRWRVVTAVALALLVADVVAIWLSLDGLSSGRLRAAEVLAFVALGGGILLGAVAVEPSLVREPLGLGEKPSRFLHLELGAVFRRWRTCPTAVLVAVAVCWVAVAVFIWMGGPLFGGKGKIVDGRYYLINHGDHEVTRDKYRDAAGAVTRFFGLGASVMLGSAAVIGGIRSRSAEPEPSRRPGT